MIEADTPQPTVHEALEQMRQQVDLVFATLKSAIEASRLQRTGERPLGIEEAALVFGCSPRQMRRYAERASKDGGAVMVGKTWFVFPELIRMSRQD